MGRASHLEPRVSGEDQGKNIDPRRMRSSSLVRPMARSGRVETTISSEKVFRENWKAVPKDMHDEMAEPLLAAVTCLSGQMARLRRGSAFS